MRLSYLAEANVGTPNIYSVDFTYRNAKHDPKPDVISLGTWIHPRTGNKLLVGLNKHYFGLENSGGSAYARNHSNHIVGAAQHALAKYPMNSWRDDSKSIIPRVRQFMSNVGDKKLAREIFRYYDMDKIEKPKDDVRASYTTADAAADQQQDQAASTAATADTDLAAKVASQKADAEVRKQTSVDPRSEVPTAEPAPPAAAAAFVGDPVEIQTNIINYIAGLHKAGTIQADDVHDTFQDMFMSGDLERFGITDPQSAPGLMRSISQKLVNLETQLEKGDELEGMD